LPHLSDTCHERIAMPRDYDDEPAGSVSVFGLWIIPLLLSVFGVVLILSMTGWNLASQGAKQAFWFIISMLGFLVMTQIPLRFWYRCCFPLLILSLGFMALTVFSPLRVTVKGASRWLRFGPVNFQPLELAGFMMMICLSRFYCRTRGILRAIVISALLLAPFAVILFLQPDFGGFLLLVGIAGALFAERFGMALPAGFGLAVAPLLWYFANSGYRAERIQTWLDPWTDPLGSGYQVIQGLIAFANGRMWGIGLGRGEQFLPEVHNDFIFPALGEQCGLVGSMGVFLLFLIWSFYVFAAYRKAVPERRMLIWGCFVAVMLPFFINLGGVMKIIPLTGMPLPFISYGGTSLIFMWARIGLLIRLVTEPEELE
jgi:cell division protein FtsW